MTTTLRNCSFIDPNADSVRIRGLAASMGMAGRVSVRKLIDRRDRVRVSRWAVCIATFGGAPRATAYDNAFVDRVFGDVDGVAGMIRHASGGRRYLEWETFGPLQLMTIAQKQEFAKQGIEIVEYRKAAAAQGIAVERYPRIMWLIDDNGVSTGGTTPSDSLVGAVSFGPALAAHEITHALGVCSHADRSSLDDYANPYCYMGLTPGRCSFSAPRLGSSNSGSGPGMIAPYLSAAGWLELPAHTHHIAAPQIGGEFVLTANHGAPSLDAPARIALVIGDGPGPPGGTPQFWVEYRSPRGFDRNVSLVAPPWAGAGVLLVHRVELGSGRCPGKPHAWLHSESAATLGARTGEFRGARLQVTGMSVDKQRITLMFVNA